MRVGCGLGLRRPAMAGVAGRVDLPVREVPVYAPGHHDYLKGHVLGRFLVAGAVALHVAEATLELLPTIRLKRRVCTSTPLDIARATVLPVGMTVGGHVTTGG